MMKLKYKVEIKIDTIVEIDESELTEEGKELIMSGKQLVAEEGRKLVREDIAELFGVPVEEVKITHEDVRGIVDEE